MTYGVGIDYAEPGVAVVVLEGEQETFQSSRLSPQLAALVRQGTSVVVDLSRATFVDSTTLAALLTAQREARRAGCGFVLEMDETMAPYARRIFQITGLGSLFSIVTGREDAITAARAGEAGAHPESEPA